MNIGYSRAEMTPADVYIKRTPDVRPAIESKDGLSERQGGCGGVGCGVQPDGTDLGGYPLTFDFFGPSRLKGREEKIIYVSKPHVRSVETVAVDEGRVLGEEDVSSDPKSKYNYGEYFNFGGGERKEKRNEDNTAAL